MIISTDAHSLVTTSIMTLLRDNRQNTFTAMASVILIVICHDAEYNYTACHYADCLKAAYQKAECH
jgi:hypothetical protein